MKYPTLEEVAEASHEQVCRWWRFLDSPGQGYIGLEEFDTHVAADAEIMDAIFKRLTYFGGFTPEISKLIGWNAL